MSILIILIPITLCLGIVGLVAFLWNLKSGQYNDLEGAANRILFDQDSNDDKKLESESIIESGMTTHLCVSAKQRHKDIAKYVISTVIDYGYNHKIYTGYHYIREPKTASNILVFNYYLFLFQFVTIIYHLRSIF